ncbi:MAG: hypothetical protein GTN81_01715 [Proteobacteria bacterium]|nr:hypothetical protein [Pseudomonadota bacterium]
MKKHVIVSVVGLIIVIALILFVFLISIGNARAHEKGGMMGQTPASMMGDRMMGWGQMGHSGKSLKRILHVWTRLLLSQKDALGLSDAQLDGIQNLITTHMKETIRIEAERRIIGIELRELLAKEETDFSEVEKKIKSKSNLKGEMDLSGVRTFQKVKNLLSEDQRKKLHASFKPLLFSMMNHYSSPCMMDERSGMMKKGGMMGQESMMKGMMGGGMMQGSSQTETGHSSLIRTDSQGPVTVKVAFDPQQQTQGNELRFKVEMDTHSVELGDIDLGRLSVLRDEGGAQFTPSEWSSPGQGGHHVEGTLVFQNSHSSGKRLVGPDTRYVELVIRDIGEVKERVFRWDLKQ